MMNFRGDNSVARHLVDLKVTFQHMTCLMFIFKLGSLIFKLRD